MKSIITLAGFSLAVLTAGCGSAETANSNSVANTSAANRIQNVDVNNLPAGLSASPIVPVNSVNAINSASPGATATPGIPDPKTLGQPMKPGATPTPGIPDPETIKKQMEQLKRQIGSNSNQPQPPPPGASDGPAMRKKRNIANVNN